MKHSLIASCNTLESICGLCSSTTPLRTPAVTRRMLLAAQLVISIRTGRILSEGNDSVGLFLDWIRRALGRNKPGSTTFFLYAFQSIYVSRQSGAMLDKAEIPALALTSNMGLKMPLSELQFD